MKVYVVTLFDETYSAPVTAFLSEEEAADFCMNYKAGYMDVIYHEVEVEDAE
jgi:hypothetical protein